MKKYTPLFLSLSIMCTLTTAMNNTDGYEQLAQTTQMDTEIELTQFTSQQSTPDLLNETPTVDQNKIDPFDSELAQQMKYQALESQIKKRKLCNVLYGITTLTMMTMDIFNSYYDEKSYWDEKKLIGQQVTCWKSQHPNECCYTCPDQNAYCDKITHWNRDGGLVCPPAEDSTLLSGVNNSMTVWRLYSGFLNLYSLYQVQQALNAQSIIEDNETYNEEDTSRNWCKTQIISSAIISTIASTAGIIDNVANYPRTVAVWGVNAAVDMIGAFNWYENKKACAEVIAYNKTKLKGVTTQLETEHKNMKDRIENFRSSKVIQI